MFVNETSGNIGIGTTGPDDKLVVAGTVKIQTATDANQIEFYSTTNSDTEWIAYLNGEDLRFWDTTPRITFQKGGNVGIGTTSPSAKLDVSNSSQGVVIHPTGGVGNSPYINTTGTTNVTITSSGGSVIIKLG